ncbi:MAG: glycosyltransferase [Fibrobacteres bacterium]|nr:glycosyltransferase [Fibrobacterota bacterium]
MNDERIILVVIPAQGGSRALGENVITALKKNGHDVTVFDINTEKAIFAKNTNDKNRILGMVNSSLLSKAESIKPDLLLVIALAPIFPDTLDCIRKSGIKTAHYFCEDLRAEEHWQPIIKAYDHFFIIQKEPWLTICREQNRLTYYLPNGAPVELMPATAAEKKYDLVFAGAPYENRIHFFEKLLASNLDFRIFGWGWNRVPLSEALRKRVVGGGEWLNYSDLFNIYSEARIVLNLHSTLSGNEIERTGDFVNPRSFVIPLAHTLQLSDRREALFEFFTEGMDIACFSSMEELTEKAEYYLAHPDSTELLVNESRNTVLKRHLLTHRMSDLINAVFQTKVDKTFNDLFLDVKKTFKEGKLISDEDMLIMLAEDVRTKSSSSENG